MERDLGEEVWRQARERLDRAAGLLGLDPGLHAMLSRSRRAVEVSVPVRLDSGELRTFAGFRVQHNLSRGPAKGGLRYHPRATLAEAKALAMGMSWKCALVGIPYGGGKGAVRCHPGELSSAELEKLTRRYTYEISPLIGPGRDILAPDLNTSEREMGWILDTYNATMGSSLGSPVTGRPVIVGGLSARGSATGVGVAHCVRRAVDRTGLKGRVRVVISGFGAVGQAAARDLASDERFRVTGIGDVTGGRFAEKGLQIGEAVRDLRDGFGVRSLDIGEPVERDELLEMETDVLVPAAVEGVVTAHNAPRIRAQLVVEGANGPLTPAADAALGERGVVVVPDLLANAGGVLASHFEWGQEWRGAAARPSDVLDRVRSTLDEAFTLVAERAASAGITLREAALCIGVQRVADAHLALGLYP